ncbi:MAG: sugar transferase [Bacteroidetes bacterium]|nr:sugar transferase [Bacteroidota bacterium]
MKDLIIQKTSLEVYEYFSSFAEMESPETLVVSTTNDFNILNHIGEIKVVVNLSRVNDIRYLNKFFESVNFKLKKNGRFICCLETFSARKERKSIGKIPILRNIYFGVEFIFMRVFPKVAGLKKIYFLLTRGRNRVLSKAEVLGRLVSCGFEIDGYYSFNGLLYVITKKIKAPEFNMNASYGPLYKMPRIGKNGKIIGVYKFRTMHPYAEYLQSYVLKNNGYNEKGKPADDFRLTPWGKFLRKYWLDELPQLINVFKGEMSIIGVRPISETRFNEFPNELQEKRKKIKPGCIPPYVSLNMPDDLGNIEAERIYLESLEKNPFTTKIKFFFMALYNIFTNKIRSA